MVKKEEDVTTKPSKLEVSSTGKCKGHVIIRTTSMGSIVCIIFFLPDLIDTTIKAMFLVSEVTPSDEY